MVTRHTPPPIEPELIPRPTPHHEEEPVSAVRERLVDSNNPGTKQLSIPRKPVGSWPTDSVQPIRCSYLGKNKQAIERSQPTIYHDQLERTRSRRSDILKIWWLELTACLLFLTAFVAIIATLYPHHGKPLPEWLYQLSVNALLSIYVVVLKGTVLLVTAEGLGQLKWRWMQQDRPLQDLVRYDQATRGPLGALNLLWELRLRHPLASVGALVTLLTLATDPFTQQVVHYYNCNVPLSGIRATIPRTNMFVQRRDWSDDTNSIDWVEPNLREAIVNGIVSLNGPVVAQCLTGNCTFAQEYSTVAYCSSCIDITKDMTIRSTIVNSNYTGSVVATELNPNGTNTTSKIDNVGIARNTNNSVSTSLPSGLSILAYPGTSFNLTKMQVFRHADDDEEYHVEIILGKQFELFDPATGDPPKGCNNRATNDTWFCKGYGAASCSLYPCVRSYTATVEAGELHETRVSTSDNASNSWGHFVQPSSGPAGPGGAPGGLTDAYEPYLGIIDTVCLSADERQNLMNTGYHLDENTKWLAYNLTFNPLSQNISGNTTFPESMMFHECIYTINNLFVNDLWDAYLTDLFEGSVDGDSGGSGGPQNGAIETLYGSQILQVMYNYGYMGFDRINDTFQNISDSMTAYFRQESIPKYSDPAKGLVMYDQTCLSVRWAWLAFPATLVMLTITFFFGMLIDTRLTGKWPLIWKSSPLPLIFHGLEAPNHTNKEVYDLDDMDGVAKGMIVRIDATREGLSFVASEGDHIKGR